MPRTMKVTYTDTTRIGLAREALDYVRSGFVMMNPGAVWRVDEAVIEPGRMTVTLEAVEVHAVDPRTLLTELPLPNEVELSTVGKIEVPVSQALTERLGGP